MIQTEKIPPGTGVSLSFTIPPKSHKRLKNLRSAVNFYRKQDHNLDVIYQMAIEAGLEALETELKIQPEPTLP